MENKSKYCDVCCILIAHGYQEHIAGKKHLRNVRQEELRKRITERSIFVCPLPKYAYGQDLIRFFLQFGTIESHKFGSNHLIIEFDKREPVDFLLNNPIWMGNFKLDIKRRNYNYTGNPRTDKNSPAKVQDESPICYVLVKNIFERENTFEDQLNAFLNAVQLSDVEIEARYKSICNHLDRIFRVIFPNCKTQRFGSTQNGLGFKECDLDIYMDVGNFMSEGKNIDSSVKEEKVFKEVKRIMYRMSDTFSSVIPIPKARMPIIKFYYIPTKISCDISFKNGLGVHNSCLIKHYLTFDVRIKPLMILIKYWARQFGISGSGKISNYALIMLIIFCLQQPSVGLLPPLMDLQKNCEPQLVNGWQVNFDKTKALPASKNTSSIPELVYRFFSYYASFDYKSLVICPFDATAHNKNDFKKIEDLPECMARYKEYAQDENFPKLNVSKAMCVQDPIELNYNVTTNTSPRILETFQKCCYISAEICLSAQRDQYKELLASLFNTMPDYEMAIDAGRFLRVGLPQDFETRDDFTDREQFIKDNWYFTIFNIVKDILEKVFKLEVDILSADKETKQQKIDTLSDVHTRSHQKIILHCVGSNCVWRNRAKSKLTLDPSLSQLEKEAQVSDRIIKSMNKSGNAGHVRLNFICKLEKKQNPVQVLLSLTNQNSDTNVFQEFITFAKSKLIKIIGSTLIHMQQFKKHY